MPDVEFFYLTGVRTQLFRAAELSGSWDADGHLSSAWSTTAMTAFVAEDGCPGFRCSVALSTSDVGRLFSWGVAVSGVGAAAVWGIPSEVNDVADRGRHRQFTLAPDGQDEIYYLTHCRRLGANKVFSAGQPDPAIRFATWAPNARSVAVVLGGRDSGYIFDDGRGVVAEFPLRADSDGVWSTDSTRSPELLDYPAFDHAPYMFRLTKDDGQVAYRTDLYSRCQIGRGRVDPGRLGPDEPPFSGNRADVDGTVSCSVVVDPERATELFSEPVWPERQWQSETEFWSTELDPRRPLPTRLEDLVIYELHVGGLGFNRMTADGDPEPGTLEDAIGLLDYLAELGVNAIELLPMSEYEGWASWGYGTSHYFAIEYSGGGRDQFKHFVRECHRRGLAVILDVVYNHYHHQAERAEWTYDSNEPERNIYYWYEGHASDYPNANPPGSGGYIDNQSTGYAPRFWDEMVRKLFISSAVALALEFRVDGFRLDQTTSIHSYAVVHSDGRSADSARAFGGKFLREFTRTLKLVKPTVFLIAEDHSGWNAVTEAPDAGGLGFDATWYSDFYHNLIGDTCRGPECANLLSNAAFGDRRDLAMTRFASVLEQSGNRRVVYHESHDEAGNSTCSGRTLAVAVNRAPLVGDTRRWGEARTRVAAGVALLSGGTPMFFMGEEIGASTDYRYNDFVNHRDDLIGARDGEGRRLYRYYQDVIALRKQAAALRSRDVRTMYVHDGNRVLAFLRSDGFDDFLVLVNLGNGPFGAGYWVNSGAITDGSWREVLNSDSALYGGWNVGNGPAVLSSRAGGINAVLPAVGLLVLQRMRV
jgi:1,4-alpha-glucan branching enzyme